MAKRLAFLTSGGDAPGMNACLRAIVRVALVKGVIPVGVRRGFQGLIDNDFEELQARSVSNIVQRGGTFLRTSRCKEFRTLEGQTKAKNNLEANGIDGLVIIGGDGSLAGGLALSKIWDGKVIGVPGTIDNDLYGSDLTIGCDTAVNTALDAIDRIRDTADAHERVFIVEVMGRACGFNALQVALGAGAEYALLPETPTDIKEMARFLADSRASGKTSCIVVVAEGEEEGGARDIMKQLRAENELDYRVVVLGHMQRGGAPTASDRVLATELGAYSVECFLEGLNNVMVGRVGDSLVATPIHDTLKKKKPLDKFQLSIVPMLAT